MFEKVEENSEIISRIPGLLLIKFRGYSFSSLGALLHVIKGLCSCAIADILYIPETRISGI
jgi:hypothetical protein